MSSAWSFSYVLFRFSTYCIMTSVAFDIRFSCREEDTQEQLKKGHRPHLTALSSVLGCQSREDTGSSDGSLSWVSVVCGTGLKVDWYLCPGRRKAATHCGSERREGLLYSRREQVGMALWRWPGAQMWGVGTWTWAGQTKVQGQGTSRRPEAEAVPHRTCM